jgi:hypothetical protein
MTSSGQMDDRKWVLYVTAQDDTQAFADAVMKADQGLKPFAVQPARAAGAIKAIQPAAVVVDARLPEGLSLVQGAVGRRRTPVLSDGELMFLSQRLRPRLNR